MSTFRHGDDPQTRVRTYAVTFQAGSQPALAPPHSVDWHQLIYAVRGVMRVTTRDHAWVVPPHRAVWIPAGLESSLQMLGEVAMRMLYIRTGPRALLRECAVVDVNPLLRELIVRANRLGALGDRNPIHAALTKVILDELRGLKSIPLQLPLPRDARAARFAMLAGERPQVSPSLDQLARQSGASRRTLERIFMGETTLSLGQWLRRQLVLTALAMLGSGQSVVSIADELGYSSASAFIAMFRKELGQTPARYFATADRA